MILQRDVSMNQPLAVKMVVTMVEVTTMEMDMEIMAAEVAVVVVAKITTVTSRKRRNQVKGYQSILKFEISVIERKLGC